MPRPKTKQRETSDRVSRIAARVLRMLKTFAATSRERLVLYGDDCSPCTVGDLRALAGRALSQDTTPGPRRKGRK